MPHKRAKRNVREHLQKQRGTDLAPGKDSICNEAIPKSASRILNASSIQEEWKKKRKLDEDGGGQDGKRRKTGGTDGSSSKQKGKEKVALGKLVIKPGESIQHFNRRVEDDMRPLVKSAMEISNATSRNARKAEIEAKALAKKYKSKAKPVVEDSPEPEPSLPVESKHAGRPKEFTKSSSSAPRRLNDIAQAPPEFKKLPRGATSTNNMGISKRDGILSMAQRSMMEVEREKAIARYRMIKASRRKAGEGGDERDRDGEDGSSASDTPPIPVGV